MSTVLAAQLRAITHPAGMARGDLIALEPYLCTTQSLSMPGTCGLSPTLQSKLHHLSATVSMYQTGALPMLALTQCAKYSSRAPGVACAFLFRLLK